MPPAVREHTGAIIAALEAAGALQVAGVVVGDGEAPTEPPHVTLYSLPGGPATGTLAEPEADGFLLYQVTCVGTSREQAEWLADEVIALLVSGIEVDGRVIPRVGLDFFPGVVRDDTPRPPVWTATPRFRVATTPADLS